MILPIIACYVTFLQLLVGGCFAMLLTDARKEVTPGFIRMNSVVLLLLGSFSWLAQMALEVPAAARISMYVLFGGVFLYLFLAGVKNTYVRLLFPVIGFLGGCTCLVTTAVWQSQKLGVPWTIITYAFAALALGITWAALVLGHWYLLTPRLSARPLRTLCTIAVYVLALQGIIALIRAFSAPIVEGKGPGLVSINLFIWGWLAAGIIFPGILAVGARSCCIDESRGRAIQAATGLLYIVAVAVLATAIIGNAMIYSAGLAV